MIPGLAGMSRLHYRRFLAANAAGALSGACSTPCSGYFAGHALDSIEKYSGWAASGLLVLFVVIMVALHLRRDDATPSDHARGCAITRAINAGPAVAPRAR